MTEQSSDLPELSPFETIRRVTADNSEYWSARDLAKTLGYTTWRRFTNAIEKAEIACKNSDQAVEDHFDHVVKMVGIGSKAQRKIEDINLSRYACYLIIQNADPTKEIVALGQTYFAVQTRRQEVADELAQLTENQQRLFVREQLTNQNKHLASAAKQAGVIKPIDFAIFQDHGYMGLYNGEKARDIHARKALKANQDILDYMNRQELAANLFRASLTEEKLVKDQVQGRNEANQTHYEMGQKVRGFISEVGGKMPEIQPVPKESIPELHKKERKRLKRGPQPEMFPEDKEENKGQENN